MNYHHLYHAGNFADVFKHCILINLIESLLHKDKAFCYVDTHAGIGVYDLQAEEAQKTEEYKLGISKIYQCEKKSIPTTVADYLKIVQTYNQNAAALRYYPGSPAVAKALLRPQDRMVISELHPQDYQALKQQFKRDKQVAVHHLDGYQSLKAFLPPETRRGLVLIDPPYENPAEYKQILAGLKLAFKRWETGIYAIWYPIKSPHQPSQLLNQLQKLASNILVIELSILPADSPIGLIGSGMIVLNSPWQLDQKINSYLSWLWQTLSINQTGSYRIEMVNVA